jgi:hypothetical protein
MSEALLQELVDREAIRELKARYFRYVDEKDWDAWREVFTADVHVELPGMEPFDDVDPWVAFVAEAMAETRTIHQGHMPELTIESATEARGSWALFDYVEWPEGHGQKGYGRYNETYRKVDGEWRIASLRLEYLRVDPLVEEPKGARV